MVENLYKKTFRELCNDVEESMKHTLDILSEIYDRAAGLDMDKTLKKEETPKTEETPKKTVKKRQPKKSVKKQELAPAENTLVLDEAECIAEQSTFLGSRFLEDKGKETTLVLNPNAPIAEHHFGDKGKGQIDYDRINYMYDI
tara:strand:- start:220 stop:648 length:429 start_codon:yes stop_codon:yes gene_type:complete